jgi:hypothetical protein
LSLFEAVALEDQVLFVVTVIAGCNADRNRVLRNCMPLSPFCAEVDKKKRTRIKIARGPPQCQMEGHEIRLVTNTWSPITSLT